MPRTLFQEYTLACGGGGGGDRTRQDMLKVTRDYLEEMERDSTLFAPGHQNGVSQRRLPCFAPSELALHHRIGMGEFGVVWEVSEIHLDSYKKKTTENREGNNVSSPQHEVSSSIQSAVSSGKNCNKPLHHYNSKSCGDLPLEDWGCTMDHGEDHQYHHDLLGQPPPDSLEHEELRQRLAQKVMRQVDVHLEPFTHHKHNKDEQSISRPRFAVKQIRKDLYPKKKLEAGKDLAREAKFLSRLEHPNIIRLRATVGAPGEQDFMLFLDRLGITLSEEITHWHDRLHSTSGAAASLMPGFWKNNPLSFPRKETKRSVLSERLLALYDVACGMQYLHRKAILFRDLKTENVARNHHGAFQLLDFGLAKELKAKDRVMATSTSATNDDDYAVGEEASNAPSFNEWDDNVYRLTGLTGTLRIMSPEVLQCQPYGLSADIFSFGIMLWEVFQGHRNRLSPAEIVKGERPELPVPEMPPRVVSLIRKCYGTPAFRPTFAMLSQELEYQLLELQQEHSESQTEPMVSSGNAATQPEQQGYSSELAGIFHRFTYLRQLSMQSLGATTAAAPAAAAVTAVEN